VPAGGGGGPGGGADGAVWARSRPAPLGEPFWVPAPEDHLLILSAHLMKHSFEPGIWFTDLEALLRAEPALDWGAVISRAGEWGLLRPLAYSLRGLGLLDGPRFGAPALALPAAARGALMAARPGPLDRLLLSLAGRSTRLRGEKEEWERPPIANLLWLSSREGLGAKLGLLWEAAFPRHEVMGQIYPGYRPALRGWFLLRRAADLLRLALRLAARLGRGR
ncbi:MAG: nucleotidyltransferase family protein, partial [Candidatus Tectomicrobia bacterium]|nr:nucleotidyltransferase family protein [Candidatus Tectomicrobia bacterium]